MRTFLPKLLLFILLFFLIDKASYFILIRFKDKVHDRRLEQVIDGKMNKDILVIGSSRGAKGIIARQIEDATGFSTFNLCYHASDITFHEFMVRTVLKFNQAPKAILLTMDDPQELWPHDNYHCPSFDLFPLLHRHYINEQMISMGDHGLVSRFLWTSRIKKQHLFPEYQSVDAFDSIQVDGSQTINHYANRNFEQYLYPYVVENELPWKTSLLETIEEHCQENNVQLIFVYPPNYKIHNPEFVQRMKALTGPEVLHCVYNYQDSIYLNKDLFYDADHMHVSGAKAFTDEIIDFLGEVDLGVN